LAHAYFERRIFSKFFGGKIKNFETDVTYSKHSKKLKKRRMRILGARIFSKSFGGKIETVQTDVTKEKN